jgi:hypothetical protein
MGAYEKLPKNAIKIADIEHDFNEISFQFDLDVNTAVYFSRTGYCNVFAIYLKTDFTIIENLIGEIEPSYDCVLIIRAIDKDETEVKKSITQILHITLMTLIYEMGILNNKFEIRVSKTQLGKKIHLDELNQIFEKLKKTKSKESLLNYFILK